MGQPARLLKSLPNLQTGDAFLSPATCLIGPRHTSVTGSTGRLLTNATSESLNAKI